MSIERRGSCEGPREVCMFLRYEGYSTTLLRYPNCHAEHSSYELRYVSLADARVKVVKAKRT